ncbi:MAG: hypothetical protein ABGZ17_07675 [Planctomycetaceae bacterium]
MQAEYDLLRKLPCITAEMTAAHGALIRSSVVYLSDPREEIDKPDTHCHGFDYCGNRVTEWVPWEKLRSIKIRRVDTSVGRYCVRLERNEMEELVERIREELIQQIDDFSTGIDDL